VADPDLWAAIFLANQDAMLRAIDRFGERLAEFRQLLAAGDRQSVERWLSEGKRVRDALGS
jgi:cyclohexadieny/prephenate dehydrogenase/prephenate dehydrogenase